MGSRSNSIKSRWVESEVETAFEEEAARGGTVLFPIRLDDAVLRARGDWAHQIRQTRHIGDFSGWRDPAAYRLALDQVLRDLRAT